MSEHDDELERWIHRVVAAAGSDTPDRDELTAHGVSIPPRRWPVAAAAAVLVVLGIGGIVWTTRPDDSPQSASPITTDTSGPAATSPEAAEPSSSASSLPTVVTQAATPTTPTVELARPIIDVEWCQPTWARTRNLVFEGAYIWPRQNDIPIQVFVPAGGSMTEQFAVALRITNNLRLDVETANAEVNGQPARSSFASPTWGELLWRLPDGTEAYLRTSTMTSDELIALATRLEPRPLTDPLPGFANPSVGYEVLAEDVTPITVTGIVDTACEPEQGGWMTATVSSGTLAQALFLTDRPAVPYAARGLEDGRLLIVTGRDDIADRSQEVVDSVRDATDEEWATLNAANPNSFEPNKSPDDAASVRSGVQRADTPATG